MAAAIPPPSSKVPPSRTTSVRLSEETFAKIDSMISIYGFDSYSDVWQISIALLAEQIPDAIEEIAGTFSLAEWNAMRELFQHERPTKHLLGNALGKHLANIAHTVNRGSSIGAKYFGENATDAVRGLVAKLKKLSLIEAWAVLLSAMWAQRHEATIDFSRDRWWTLEYRQQVARRTIPSALHS